LIEGQENLPDLPDGWNWANFPELAANKANALKAGPFGSALKKSFYVPSGYKIYGQEQVIKGDPYYGDYYIDENKFNDLISCSVAPPLSLVGNEQRRIVEKIEALTARSRIPTPPLNEAREALRRGYRSCWISFGSRFWRRRFAATSPPTGANKTPMLSLPRLC
jgi:hypothetical protein